MSAASGEGEAPSSGRPKAPRMHLAKDKICLVCGDRALGYNFNAMSCESCKAFFRRNAFKEIKGRCNGTCDVTVESRSYCKRCRLQKCFKVGMKRELILSEQQKQQRCHKIQENRLRRFVGGGQSIPSTMTGDASQSCGLFAGQETVPGSTPQLLLDSSTGPEQALTHVIASTVDPSSIENMSPWCREMLLEVMRSFQTSFDKPMERQPIDAPSNVEFLNMADTSVRRLVKMAKQLTVFRSLDQVDQIALLKGAVVEVLILRSAKMFNSSTLSWQVNKEGKDHSVSASSFKQGPPESFAFIQNYQKFVGKLLRSTCNDNVVLMLLIVMTVFSPDRANPKSIAIIAKAQEEYASILQEYVLMNYAHEPLMFPRLLQRLTDIRDMNEKHTAMLLNMQIDQLEPLIIEIFDIGA